MEILVVISLILLDKDFENEKYISRALRFVKSVLGLLFSIYSFFGVDRVSLIASKIGRFKKLLGYVAKLLKT